MTCVERNDSVFDEMLCKMLGHLYVCVENSYDEYKRSAKIRCMRCGREEDLPLEVMSQNIPFEKRSLYKHPVHDCYLGKNMNKCVCDRCGMPLPAYGIHQYDMETNRCIHCGK